MRLESFRDVQGMWDVTNVVVWFASNDGWVYRNWIVLGEVRDFEYSRT